MGLLLKKERFPEFSSISLPIISSLMQKKIHFVIKGQIGLKFYEVKEKEKFVLTTRISPEPLESARP